MKTKVILLLLNVFLVMACSSEDCIKCSDPKNEDVVVEFCDDSEINYTDIDGNPLEYQDLKAYLESLGHDCE